MLVMKWLFLLMIGVLVFSCQVLEQSIEMNQGGPVAANYQDTVEVEVVRDKVILPLRVNGESKRFIFDTGALTVVSRSLYREMDYPVVGRDHFFDIHGNSETSEVVRTGSMKLGNLVFKHVPALVYDLDKLPWKCFRVDGIIGSNMLRHSVVQVDLRDSVLILSNDAGQLNMDSGRSVRMQLDKQGSPYVPVRLGGEPARFFLFDSGREGLINVGKEYFSSMEQNIHYQIEKTGRGSDEMGMVGTGEEEQVYQVALDSFFLSGHTLHKPVIKVTSSVSSLGQELFRYGRITMDFKRQRFLMEPYDDSLVYQPSQNMGLGFSPVIERDTFRVGLVWQHSLVDSLGLEPGNRILRINQYNYADSPEKAFCESFLNQSLEKARSIEMIYQDRKGHYKRVKIRKKQ